MKKILSLILCVLMSLPIAVNALTDIDVGGENPPVTNLDETDDDLILHLDLGDSTTDNIIDKTDVNKIDYNQDFEIKLDDDLRLFKSTIDVPDSIEKNNLEQPF